MDTTIKQIETKQAITSSTPTAQPMDISRATPSQQTLYGNELLQAYTYAHNIGITTIDHIDNANLHGYLTRAQAAKMLSQFTIQILRRSPDTHKQTNFSDIEGYGDLTARMKTSYQLGLMGINTPQFNPNAPMTRAEFGTVLSRALRGNTYDQQGEKYYETHLQQLQKL
jgi:hypothetical protein